ncbi:winged helix-turn-helix transcriptional regulator (plasmid) [Haloarcula salina]|uniref:winged helix-turn-helix transcriptional regulator n=1 Tax=Haloarcula salina TaxID=1429914 RepID=UPI003C70021F
MGRTPAVTKEQVFQVLRDRDRDSEPVLATNDVAERVGTSRPTAKKRLDALVEDGRVATNTHGQVPVYWPVDERMAKHSTPISGELLEDVDAYAEKHGGDRGDAVRRLVEIGLEAESVGVKPGEMKVTLDSLEDEVDRYKDEIDRWKEYTLAGGLVTLGLVLAILGVGGSGLPSGILGGYLPTVVEGLQLLSGVTMLAGVFVWLALFFSPYINKLTAPVRNSLGRD